MKERTFNEGDTIATEGQSGIGFFIIDEGEAAVCVGGEERATLGHGDYFGEVALIDDGARTATITAKSPLKCYGITSWEFRPLVEQQRRARLEDAADDGEAATRGRAARGLDALRARRDPPRPGRDRR